MSFNHSPLPISGSSIHLFLIVPQFSSSHQRCMMSLGQWDAGEHHEHLSRDHGPPLPWDAHLGKPTPTPFSPETPGLLFICTEKGLFFNKEGLYFPVAVESAAVPRGAGEMVTGGGGFRGG